MPLPSTELTQRYKEITIENRFEHHHLSVITSMMDFLFVTSQSEPWHRLPTANYYKGDVNIYKSKFGNISRLCTFVAGHLFVFGQWHLLDCSKKVISAYIICEKEHKVKEEFRALRIKPTNESCLYSNQYYMNGVCYQLVNTATFRINSCQKHQVSRPYPTIAGENILSKWTYKLTNVIGFMRNQSCVTVLRKLCMNCSGQFPINWRKSEDCENNNNIKYWLCQSAPVYISNLKHSNKIFKCEDGTYILQHYYCDKTQHCEDNSDEKFCPWSRGKNNVNRKTFSFLFITHHGVMIPLYEWYAALKLRLLKYNTQYPMITRRTHNVQNMGACPIGWSRCSKNNDSQCYPNEHVCVYERDIYGEPLYCANTANIKDCPTTLLKHICPSMFKCNSSYCIPYHMVSESQMVIIKFITAFKICKNFQTIAL